ncbi:MAG: hypothetical protein ACYC7A_14665 [Thermoanaerobaculia bacterium]
MNFVRLLPVILSSWLLGAHFLRSWNTPVVALFVLLPLLLFVRRPWVARVFQVVLLLGALEWVWTTIEFTRIRMAVGEPWVRMVVILGVVALFTAASALVFRSRGLRQRYFGSAEAA